MDALRTAYFFLFHSVFGRLKTLQMHLFIFNTSDSVMNEAIINENCFDG